MLLLMGEGLDGSAGGSAPEPWTGLTKAGSIIVPLTLGLAISNADWREWVGEGGGPWSSSLAAVSISSPAGGAGTTS